MSKRVREKCGKLFIFSIPSSKRGITPTKIDGHKQHWNLICSTVKQNHAKFQLDISKHVREKSGKTVYFQYSKFQKGHNSYKN